MTYLKGLEANVHVKQKKALVDTPREPHQPRAREEYAPAKERSVRQAEEWYREYSVQPKAKVRQIVQQKSSDVFLVANSVLNGDGPTVSYSRHNLERLHREIGLVLESAMAAR
jgi:hypothetical protein